MRFTKAATLLALATAAACAQDVGDVDRTQPNRLKKSLFDGEWYLQKTTFDVPFNAGFTFTGETSDPTERVRWEIQEGFLIAYRAYDYVENTQASTKLPDVQAKGAPIAAYAITSHFDVVREYNPQTGEETNVILENTEDRPWYEREYMRVDWSKNQVLSFNFTDDNVTQAPISYYVQDRSDADRLLVAVKNGDAWTETQDWQEIAKLDSADYIDIVDTLFVEPQTVQFDDDDGYGPYQYPACWLYGTYEDCQPARIKVRSSFLKIDPSEQYEAMAFPDNAIARKADGTAYKDEYGDAVRIPWFDKFGFFRVERDHYDREREITETGRTYLINRWGIWKDAPTCKQGDSYAGCTVRPIVYHLSPNFPAVLEEEAFHTVAQWNDAFKEVVNQLKYGGTKQLSEVEDVFVLKKNDYVPGQTRGQRIGDLRYSMIYYVNEPTQEGLLGYGPSATDPLTGRIVSGNAYVYGAAVESWATWGADVVDLINGKIDPTDFLEGEDVRSYVERVRGDYAATAGGDHSDERLEDARAFARSKQVKDGRHKQKILGKRKFRLDNGKLRARLARIENTPFEERLLNDEIIRAFKPSTRGHGENLLATLSPAERQRMSPARWGTTGAMRALREKRRLKLRKKCIYMAEFADDGVAGLAESLRDKPRAEVRETIMKRMFASTAEHEVGHTLGLRHNFAGSYDALNYGLDYWRLRGANPRPFQDMSQSQIRGRMREHQYASIMDYGARFNTDIHGIGLYDGAAIRFGYGQLVDVWDDGSKPNEPLADAVGLAYALHELRHYTSLPGRFGGDVERMYKRHPVPYQKVIEQLEGLQPDDAIEVPYRFCSDEYEGAEPTCNTFDEGADPWEIVKYASDTYESYYIFNSFSRDQRNLDPDAHLDRVYYRYFSHAQIQYQDWVFRGWDLDGLWEALREDAADYEIEDKPYDEAIDGALAGANAAKLGLNFLGRVVQAPEPGAYFVDDASKTFYNYDYATDVPLCPVGMSRDDCSDLNVPLGEGKYGVSFYDAASGYYFFDRLKVVGSFYDKLAAIQTITSPETNFLGVDVAADLTRYAISMYLYFPKEVTALIGGSSVESYQAFAGVVDGQTFKYRDLFAPASEYNGKMSVDPATSFTIELYSTWLGMAFLNANFDNSFNESMRLWIEGNGGGQTPTVTDPARIVRFTHPRTGRTFVAVRDSDPTAFSPAYDLVARAKALADAGADPAEIEYQVTILDTVKGMLELYGDLWF